MERLFSVGRKYDLLNALLFLPAGGSRRVRRQLVEALGLRPGRRVLELGCGTGQVTAALVDRGVQVTAVDALPEMLEATRRRAPAARVLGGDVTEIDLGPEVDHVVISFVLHNLDSADRSRLLARAASVLAPGGSIGVLDWAPPSEGRIGSLWRRCLLGFEPSPNVAELLDGHLERDVEAAGLTVSLRRRVANRRAEVLVLEPLEALSGAGDPE